MERLEQISISLAALAVTAVVFAAAFQGRSWADDHVRYIMGGPEAPVGCLSCHVYMKPEGFLAKAAGRNYLSPIDIAVSSDGDRLYVVAEESDALLEVAVRKGTTVRRIEVGRHPNAVVLSRDGGIAYVSNSWSDYVSVIDLGSGRTVNTIATGNGPAGMAIGPDGRFLYVANMFSDDISVLDVTLGVEVSRLTAGNNPYAVRLSPDGRRVFVTSRLTSEDADFRASPSTEITVVDTETRRVDARRFVRNAHVIEGIDFTPTGDLALATVVIPKQLVPAAQVVHGWMLNYGLALIEPETDGRIVVFLLDEVNQYYADPFDVVVSADGRRAFVTHSAADVVSVVDLDAMRRLLARATSPDTIDVYGRHLGLSSEFVLRRIPTGSNPKRLALSPDGRQLFVVEHLQDRISVVDTETLETVRTIDLGGPARVTTVRLGARMFHAARAFQGQFSCRSCHPDQNQDALAWDFAGDGMSRNIVNTMTLHDIGETAPFKWAGTNTSLYMQDGIRFAKHLTRVDAWPPEQLKALVAYVYSLQAPPNPYSRPGQPLTEEERRGKTIFERSETADGRVIPAPERCITCHDGPHHTVRESFFVGSLRQSDRPIHFDTPQLVNLFNTAPYLHDGSARTLEEIWTKNSLNDRHGFVNDLDKTQLNDLIAYLRTLSSPHAVDSRPLPPATRPPLRPAHRDSSAATGSSTAPTTYAWRTYTTEDGLPSDRITAVRVDGGRVWLGTDRGLVRIDDAGIKTFTKEDGLAHETVLALDVDPATGDLWIGTMGGLNRMSAGRFDTFDQLNSGLANNVVYSVAVDGETVWTATAFGASRYDTRSRRWRIFNASNAPMREPGVAAVAPAEGRVYLGSHGGGLLEWNDGQQGWNAYASGRASKDASSADGLVHDVVSALSYSDKVLWVGTYRGLSLFDGARWKEYLEDTSGLAGNVIHFIRARGANGWIGTDGGLSSFDGVTWHTYQRQPDGRGRVVISAADGTESHRVATATAIGHNVVLGIDFQDEIIWVATEHGASRGEPVVGHLVDKPI